MTHMSGAEALMEVFKKEGVEYIFGIQGATEVYFMDALENTPEIEYILGLHEVVSAGMAEGYSRASGKVGVLNLHTNSGLAAATPMLGNACIGGVPLVITPTRPWFIEGRGSSSCGRTSLCARSRAVLPRRSGVRRCRPKRRTPADRWSLRSDRIVLNSG